MKTVVIFSTIRHLKNDDSLLCLFSLLCVTWVFKTMITSSKWRCLSLRGTNELNVKSKTPLIQASNSPAFYQRCWWEGNLTSVVEHLTGLDGLVALADWLLNNPFKLQLVSFPEIDDDSLKYVLWIFKQQLVLKYEWVVEILLFLQSCGNSVVLAELWKFYCSCRVVEILLFLQSCGNSIVLGELWKFYCSCRVVEILLFLQSCGNSIVLAELWKFYCSCINFVLCI